MSGDAPSGDPGAAIPVVTTPRLVLRPRLTDDAAALFTALSDPALMRWWSRPPYADEAELRADFARDGGAWRSWAITRTGDDRAIGFVSAGEKRQDGVSEVGYFLAREAQGHGFVAEALGALVSALFAEGQRRVFADTDPGNARSIAVLTRLGFQLEGRLRGEWRTHIGVRDSLIFGLLAEEWPGPRSPVGPSPGLPRDPVQIGA